MKKVKWYEKLFNNFGWVRKQGVSLSLLTDTDTPAVSFQKTGDYIKSYASWVYACVKQRAQDVSQIQLRLFRVKNRNTGETEEVTNHEVLSLLRHVNSFTTFQYLVKAMQAYRDLAGEAFWYLVRGGNGFGRIMEIWSLRPDWIEINTDKEKFIKDYIYRVPGQSQITFKPSEIIHFKEFDPEDPYRGRSIIRAAARTIDSDKYSEEYNRKFFENSAIPDFTLETDRSLDDVTMKRLRSQWDSVYRGSKNAHKLAILEKGLTAKSFSISQKDMEFIVGMGFTRDKILALFQVPKTVLGMTENVTVSNADATDRIFAKRVVKPAMREFADTLTEFLLPMYKDGEQLFFSFDDPTPQNKEEVLKTYETLFKVGAISPNEIRDAEGFETVEGLDGHYIPANAIPVIASEEEGEEEKAVTAKVKKKYPAIPPMGLKEKITKEISEKIKNKIISKLSKYAKIVKQKQKESELGKTNWTQEQQENYWKLFVQKSENFEDQFKRLLIQIFKRQEADTLKRLENTQKAINNNDINKILFNLKTENKITIELLVPVLRQFYEDSGEDTLEILGVEQEFSTVTEIAKAYLNDRALRGVKAMNAKSKKRLRKLLSEAVDEGLSIAETDRGIRKLFKGFKKTRAEKIARTEILRAGNSATLEAYRQSNVVAGKQWFTALDDRVCQWCGPMHEKIKALDMDYFAKGESFTGNQGGTINLGFEDIGAPPLHPSCRCVLIPITISATPTRGLNTTDVMKQYMEKTKKEIQEEMKKTVDEEIGKLADEL